MPRPDSKIMQTNADASDTTDATPKPPTRLRATPANRKLANVVPLNPSLDTAANAPTETPVSMVAAAAKVAKSKSQAKRVAAMTALSPAEVKKRKRDLIESLKIAAGPLKEVTDLHKAASKDVEKAAADHAKALAAHDKARDKLVKEHEKMVKGLTKTRDGYDALVKKRAEAFEKGKAKVDAEIAKLG